MTFQQAQAEFSSISQAAQAARTTAELRQVGERLTALQQRLPLAAEFDPINDAIVALAPLIGAQSTERLLEELRQRTSALETATALLAAAAARAANDARDLTFAQPKLIAAGLTTGIGALRELRTAVQSRDLPAAAAKAEALLALLEQLQSTVRAR